MNVTYINLKFMLKMSTIFWKLMKELVFILRVHCGGRRVDRISNHALSHVSVYEKYNDCFKLIV